MFATNRQWLYRAFVFVGTALVLALLIGIAAQLLPTGISAIERADASGRCRIQGSWVTSAAVGPWDTPLVIQETITPLNAAGTKLAYVMRLVNPDVTFGFPEFAEADYMSELIGEAERTGPTTYDFSLIGYGVKIREADRNEILYIWTITGEMECIGNENKTDNVHIAVYTGDQDGDQDGYPDDDQVPFACIGPTTLAAGERVPLMPRCEAPPPE